jgi:hypothetical protein
MNVLNDRAKAAGVPTFGEYLSAWDAHLKKQADNPQWDQAEKVHDWRNHVPDFVRTIWPSFTAEQRYALAKWADDLASAELWE